MQKPIHESATRSAPKLNTLEAEAIEALQEIMQHMETSGSSGGECIIRSPDGEVNFRLTFCDWKNETICAFCEGTGTSRHQHN